MAWLFLSCYLSLNSVIFVVLAFAVLFLGQCQDFVWSRWWDKECPRSFECANFSLTFLKPCLRKARDFAIIQGGWGETRPSQSHNCTQSANRLCCCLSFSHICRFTLLQFPKSASRVIILLVAQPAIKVREQCECAEESVFNGPFVVCVNGWVRCKLQAVECGHLISVPFRGLVA